MKLNEFIARKGRALDESARSVAELHAVKNEFPGAYTDLSRMTADDMGIVDKSPEVDAVDAEIQRRYTFNVLGDDLRANSTDGDGPAMKWDEDAFRWGMVEER